MTNCHLLCSWLHIRMVATLSKIGEGAFADVYGCQGDDWRKLALKVHTPSESISIR